ncbi:MAG: hypothetical protein M1515_02595 [Candidatus Thermoplasmatota archaeon]|jgi:hypothetical protein|nr:hypothetical protein [Candidatus Thermoplasmatota archaeon]
MSDIRITPIQDKTLLILKRIQSQISTYRGYKADGDARVASQIMFEDIKKRLDISLSNLRAAIDNLESYSLKEESKITEEIYDQIAGLKGLEVKIPENPVILKQENVEKFYVNDSLGFDNSREILDNINSFRSASISGEFDPKIIEKIRENVENIKMFVEEKNKLLS